jgi:hypothetical protein
LLSSFIILSPFAALTYAPCCREYNISVPVYPVPIHFWMDTAE